MKRFHDSVNPITLRQGTADWHLLRKLSLTSSQSHESIKALLPDYGNDEDVVKVMKYLEGPDWALEGAGEAADGGDDDDHGVADGVGEDGAAVGAEDVEEVQTEVEMQTLNNYVQGLHQTLNFFSFQT